MNKILVDDWKPTKEEEMYLIPDNKLILIPFERIFNHDLDLKRAKMPLCLKEAIEDGIS